MTAGETGSIPTPVAAPDGVAFWYPRNTSAVAAIHLTEDDNWDAIAAWCGGEHHLRRDYSDEYEGLLTVTTPDGPVDAIEGEWLVRDSRGFTVWEHTAFTCNHRRAGASPDPLVMPADEFALTKRLWDDLRLVVACADRVVGITVADRAAFDRLSAAVEAGQ